MPTKPIMKLSHVHKEFPISRGVTLKALNDINLSIYEGEKFGVVGESGCGKSTLGRVILQLYPATTGSCVYYGKHIREVCPAYLAKDFKELSAKCSVALTLLGKADAMEKPTEHKNEENNRFTNTINEAFTLLLKAAAVAGPSAASTGFAEQEKLLLKAYEADKSGCKHFEEYHRLVLSGKNNEKAEEEHKKANIFFDEAQKLRETAFSAAKENIHPLIKKLLSADQLEAIENGYETGIDLGRLKDGEMRQMRRDMQMIFQDPAASLDPRQSIGSAIEEVFLIHTNMPAEERREKVMQLLEGVGLKREHFYSYPHALSGGQKQRVGIARAIALDSKFIVLDESVSALDVSVQAQILLLLNKLQEENERTYFFITHDLGVVKHFCDRILVMYLGNLCELAPSGKMFANPLHPYTKSLLASVPRPTFKEGEYKDEVLEGEVPSAVNPPTGCPFHTRCKEAKEICRQQKPAFIETEKDHFVACHIVNPIL